jgi:hypothetical protein
MNQSPTQVSSALATFGRVPVLEDVRPYSPLGTFDTVDIAATVAGAAFAHLTIIFTSRAGGVA